MCAYIIYDRACVRARIYMYMCMHLYPREFAFVYMHKCKRSFLRAFACVRLRACLRAELITNAKRVCAQNISTRKCALGSETFRMYYTYCNNLTKPSSIVAKLMQSINGASLSVLDSSIERIALKTFYHFNK